MYMTTLSLFEIDRIIEMAWEDRTPFEAIAFQFGLSEKEVVKLMRIHSKKKQFCTLAQKNEWQNNQTWGFKRHGNSSFQVQSSKNDCTKQNQ